MRRHAYTVHLYSWIHRIEVRQEQPWWNQNGELMQCGVDIKREGSVILNNWVVLPLYVVSLKDCIWATTEHRQTNSLCTDILKQNFAILTKFQHWLHQKVPAQPETHISLKRHFHVSVPWNPLSLSRTIWYQLIWCKTAPDFSKSTDSVVKSSVSTWNWTEASVARLSRGLLNFKATR